MLVRLFDLRDEVITFLEQQKQNELSMAFKKYCTQVILAYLSDIFDSLNSFNLKLQCGDSYIVTHRDEMYIEKLQLWRRRISAHPCNYSNFPKVESILEETRFKDIYERSSLKIQISNHLESPIEEFQKYFPNAYDSIFRMSIDPFHVNIDSLPESLQEDALRLYLPFSSTYLCEKSFSTFVSIKTKYRNKLNGTSDLLGSLIKTEPRIGILVKKMQAHSSH
ncbi:protein FAM200A-like [Diabrotica undecimpunctata]|uniref:protein FAM200A-like n=1 Tax=Diabrotica undecimpunctata TaxID=50387 RepID=UPI003B63225D